MLLDNIKKILYESYLLTHHTEYVIMGSCSIYGKEKNPPKVMTKSDDLDLYPLNDPGRASEIADKLGLGTLFEKTYGYYADAISPKLATLAEDWEKRLIRVDFPDKGIVGLFLDPNDAALSKYARLEKRDRSWIRAGLKAEILSIPTIKQLMIVTQFHADERNKVKQAVAEDDIWLSKIKAKSKKVMKP